MLSGNQRRHRLQAVRRHYRAPGVNVGDAERVVSVLGGGALALYGLNRGSLVGLGLAALGGALLYRGITGHSPTYSALGISTGGPHGPATSVPAGRGVRVQKTFTINCPPEDLYRAWRNLENLPRFMHHLHSVKNLGNHVSHWVVQAPLGGTVEWEAEIFNDKPNELIAWRSLQGSMMDTAGSVHFRRAPQGQGTEVQVELKYDPPAGRLGAALARFLGANPERQIEEDLRRFRDLMEAGRIPPKRF
jgi:uncharacterized membrane protein